jgi:transposase-like protein
MTESIYLIEIRTNSKQEKIYKIGHTTRKFEDRYAEYSQKNPNIKLVLTCENSLNCEQDILNLFRPQFKERKDYGNEYFSGDVDEMKKVIMNYMIKYPTHHRRYIPKFRRSFHDNPPSEEVGKRVKAKDEQYFAKLEIVHGHVSRSDETGTLVKTENKQDLTDITKFEIVREDQSESDEAETDREKQNKLSIQLTMPKLKLKIKTHESVVNETNQYNSNGISHSQFECPICHKEFTRSSYVKKHISTIHNPDREPKKQRFCPICHTSFTRNDNMRRHQEKVHKSVKNEPLVSNLLSKITELQSELREKNEQLELKMEKRDEQLRSELCALKDRLPTNTITECHLRNRS